jgi:RimK family alpha-L-glutamate ligase
MEVSNMKLWAIYKKEDAIRNEKFINYLSSSCLEKGISFELIYLENLVLGVINNKLEIIYENKIVRDLPDGVINRTNNHLVSKQFESKGVRCFNNSHLTQIANDKNLCYQYVSKANIKIQDTLFNNYSLLSFPLVLKNPLGRGGNEVFLIKNENELKEKCSLYPSYTLQSYCENKIAKDLRVYVINNKIVKAILRKSTKDFRANYSISKSAEVYELKDNEISLINKVINLFSIDYAGIDFLINENNELIFNEIEDSVGARALYELTDINIASLYIEHIYKTLLCL